MEHGRVAAKPKVVFVLGATATGKSKLAIALAERFNGEVINADKIQVHDGVPIITNKVTEEEKSGVPHHLLSVVGPDADFTAEDFRALASGAVARVLAAGRLPVVAGGSNTYIEALVEGHGAAFRAAHDLLFVWVDAERETLEWYAAARVDDMVARGLVDEARAAFAGDASDYTRGVRRAIGLPEMHAYLAAERGGDDAEAEELAGMLRRAVREIKENTFRLAQTQTEKIRRLSKLEGWDVRRVDVTPVLKRKADGGEGACHEEIWKKVVWEPAEEMVRAFLEETPTAAAATPATTAAAVVQDDGIAAAGVAAAFADVAISAAAAAV
ncbi:unnamed protein product [Urochloa decumbens]|uniref:adenylate dimethylallyltransferase (ADP/ATP-dependent) n=1 Tax=Urochloa decumbens TaxID=240449 RepID=A0ABC9CYH4_9POAL